ncbi:MAG: alkaline phosphatase family protein [Clostridia bacterium]|nr:alkaline phosphatase family protein [Clostridia bacterium]
MKMIFIFIDGFGMGNKNPEVNPIIAAKTPGLDYIFSNFEVIPTDACLGIPGLPQSATGQTTIFTGINASKVLNRHLNGQPTITLKQLIYENNLFKELSRRGLKFTNANVYRDEYLQKMMDETDRLHRPSVTSVMSMSAGLSFRTIEDFKAGNGVYHDITGQILIDSGYDVRLNTPQEAAQKLYAISRGFDFTLYEHFMTDIIGHKMDMDLAVGEIQLLDSFLGELIKLIDLEEDVVFITSDHGNIEDISVKTHTFNKVPTIIIGKQGERVRLEIESLTDIMPSVLKIFGTL